MSRTLIPVLAGVLALSGCAAIPDLGAAPRPATAGGFATAKAFSAPTAEWPADSWWTAYADPQLDQLMAEALKGENTGKHALLRLSVLPRLIIRLPLFVHFVCFVVT